VTDDELMAELERANHKVEQMNESATRDAVARTILDLGEEAASLQKRGRQAEAESLVRTLRVYMDSVKKKLEGSEPG